MAYENDILTRNDNDELAVRTVQSVGDNPASSYDDVYTRDNNGKLAVRVVGSGGGDSHNKGYFATQAALEEAYPTGEAGDYAIVGSTDTVWIWDDDNSEWVDTDTKGEVVSVNGKTGTVVLNAADVGALENTATGTDSLTILGTPATSNSGAINIGSGSSATGAGIAIGKNSTSGKIAIGVNANCSANGFMAIGNDAEAGTFGTAIGDGAKATGNTALAIGYGARATAGTSIAIGNASRSTANYAIQIGGAGVTNNEANTMKIGIGSLPAQNYKLLDSDGTIPSDRLVHAINKYSTMPTAASTNEGWIVQFTGTTDSTYTHGHLYECVSDGQDPATYSWAEVSMGGGAVNSVNNQTGYVFLDAEDVGAIPQYADMPESNQAGEVAQYIGEYDGTYKKGYFYKSVEVPGDVASGNININFYWPQELTPPVVGSVDIDTFSAYLSQNGYAPVSSDPRIEIVFQPGSNNILFAYNVDTSWNTINLSWTTLTTQAAEALFVPLGFDFDFSSVPTNGETDIGGYMPTSTVYIWEKTNVQDGVAFYGYDPENLTFDDLGKIYCRSEYSENAVGFYKVFDASIDSYVSGYAKVNSFNWNINPTDFPKVNIDSTILEDFFTNDNSPLDYTLSRIEITVDDVEIEPGVDGYEIKIKHNSSEDESVITVSTHTLEGIIQALENIGIYIDIDEVPNGIQYLNMDIPVEGTFQGDLISVRGVLPEQLGQSGKFLTTDGTDVSWGTTVENHTLVIKNSQTSMYGGYPNQITFYSKYNGSDGTGASIQSGNNGSMVLSASSIATTGAIYPSGSVNLGLDTQSGAWNTVYARNLGNSSSSYVIQIPEATAGVLAVQVSTMPTADSTRVGQIYQYIGATDANYTHGYFYECVSDGGNPATYSWTEVQLGGGGSSYTAGTGIDITSGVISVTSPTLQNTATGTNSVGILGTATNNYEVCIGKSAQTGDGGGSNIAIGYNSKAHGNRTVCIGASAKDASGNTYDSVVIGGYAETSAGYTVAIGNSQKTTAQYAIQIGAWSATNSDSNTFKVANHNGNYEMMSADGTIPEARLADTTNATQGQVLTLDSNNNAVWATPGGGGGGSTSATGTLSSANWSSNTQTINVTGVTASNNVIVAPAPASQSDYTAAGIICSAQGAGTLTFTCQTTPSSNLTVNVLII